MSVQTPPSRMIECISHLTPMDKEILRRSWTIVSRDMESLAVKIFEMIFEQAPDAKLMFSFMLKEEHREGSDKHEKRSNEFVFHALRFIQVIQSVMESLETPDNLEPLFKNVGQLHARHQEQLGFKPHYWSVFKECTLFHFRKAMKKERKLPSTKKNTMSPVEIDSAIILWREVLRVMIEKMKEGLSANNTVRKAIRETLNGRSPERERNKHSAIPTHLATPMKKTELSVVIPEFFMRRLSEAMEERDRRQSLA